MEVESDGQEEQPKGNKHPGKDARLSPVMT